MKSTILFIITKSETGGAQKFVLEQIVALHKTNKWNCLIATNQEGWLTKELSYYVNDFFLDKRIEKRLSFFYLIYLIKFIRENKPDLIIANSANGGLYGRLAGLFTFTKVVYVSHGWSSIYNGGYFTKFFTVAERILAYLSTSILCISETDRQKAIQIIKIPSNKLKVIPNSILPIEQKENFVLADFVTVCRLVSPKRVDLLIDVMAMLPEYTLDVIGDGSLLLELKQKVIRQQLKNVRFLGEISGFQDFSRYKAFCLISESEGMPMSAIEAMSCGLPLILSNVGGCNELIDKNGVLVTNTTNQIVDGLRYVIQNQAILSQASNELFYFKFNLNNTITQYTKYYNDITTTSRFSIN